jgi:hypothetical protein
MPAEQVLRKMPGADDRHASHNGLTVSTGNSSAIFGSEFQTRKRMNRHSRRASHPLRGGGSGLGVQLLDTNMETGCSILFGQVLGTDEVA